MKTLSGLCESSNQISLSKASKILSKFVYADNGVSQVINAYLHRASAAFNELNQFHRELKPLQSRRKNRRSHITDEVKMEQRKKKRKNENVEDGYGEQSKKKMKRKSKV